MNANEVLLLAFLITSRVDQRSSTLSFFCRYSMPNLGLVELNFHNVFVAHKATLQSFFYTSSRNRISTLRIPKQQFRNRIIQCLVVCTQYHKLVTGNLFLQFQNCVINDGFV
jgi:hypothetical protein